MSVRGRGLICVISWVALGWCTASSTLAQDADSNAQTTPGETAQPEARQPPTQPEAAAQPEAPGEASPEAAPSAAPATEAAAAPAAAAQPAAGGQPSPPKPSPAAQPASPGASTRAQSSAGFDSVDAEETDLQEPPQPLPSSSRPGIGLVAAAGLHTGLAAGLRLGAGDVGLEVLGGYQLLLAIWKTDSLLGDDDSGVDAGSSAQGSAELYITPWHPQPTSAIGVKGGYRYNSVLEHGFSVAITFLVDLTDRLALEVLAGGSFFPDSEDRLREELDLAPDADITYGTSTQVFEYGFELIFYP